jgi:hypothetical protein
MHLGAARAEELAALESGNPLLAAASDVRQRPSSRRFGGAAAERSSAAGDNESAASIQSKMSALFFRRERFRSGAVEAANPDHEHDPEDAARAAAEADELAQVAAMDIDRYLMDPDVLWGTRRKYMRRRVVSREDEAAGDDDAGDASRDYAARRQRNEFGRDVYQP